MSPRRYQSWIFVDVDLILVAMWVRFFRDAFAADTSASVRWEFVSSKSILEFQDVELWDRMGRTSCWLFQLSDVNSPRHDDVPAEETHAELRCSAFHRIAERTPHLSQVIVHAFSSPASLQSSLTQIGADGVVRCIDDIQRMAIRLAATGQFFSSERP